MGKLQNESRFTPLHHDLQDVIVNVLANDQVERFLPKPQPLRPAPLLHHLPVNGPRVSIAKAELEDASHQVVQGSDKSQIEPMHAAFDHVRVQVQRMYVHRQRIGFWCRAALSMVLLSVLGFVCYYVIAHSAQLEISHFL
jgi:hypothetical protein